MADLPDRACTSLWRDIHKGIRWGLSLLVTDSGSIDPYDEEAREDFVATLALVVDVMDSHARTEDAVTGPVLEHHLPELGAQIAATHAALDPKVQSLVESAEGLGAAADPRAAMFALHLDLSRFTSEYLAHIDVEERTVLPALEAAIGVDGVRELEQAFLAAIPPEEKLDGMILMLPAMNVEDRTEVLGAIRAGAPAAWFDQVWAVAAEALEPDDVAVLAGRLQLDAPAG
ncbi:MAG: hemerythrin domain-containing protein [Actinomycetes bacterium]